jgi:hypothetical protein
MTTDGGGWTLGFVRNSVISTPNPADPIEDFGQDDTNLFQIGMSPNAASTFTSSVAAWMDLNAFGYDQLRLSSHLNGATSYMSNVIDRSNLRINFGDNGYLLYGEDGYYWCGGDAAYNDAGVGQVNQPAGAPNDCKLHGSLGAGFDFSEQNITNRGLTHCGGNASTWMYASFGGDLTNYPTPGGAHAIWVRDYPRSCQEWNDGVNTDGVYIIDPDGPGGAAAFDVYCDMTTDGGGWTMILSSDLNFTTGPNGYFDGAGAGTANDGTADYKAPMTATTMAGLLATQLRADTISGNTATFDITMMDGFTVDYTACNEGGKPLGNDVYWHAGRAGCFASSHTGISTGTDNVHVGFDNGVTLHYGHFHRGGVDTGVYVFGAAQINEIEWDERFVYWLR